MKKCENLHGPPNLKIFANHFFERADFRTFSLHVFMGVGKFGGPLKNLVDLDENMVQKSAKMCTVHQNLTKSYRRHTFSHFFTPCFHRGFELFWWVTKFWPDPIKTWSEKVRKCVRPTKFLLAPNHFWWGVQIFALFHAMFSQSSRQIWSTYFFDRVVDENKE
jgi:hypothetical protein